MDYLSLMVLGSVALMFWLGAERSVRISTVVLCAVALPLSGGALAAAGAGSGQRGLAVLVVLLIAAVGAVAAVAGLGLRAFLTWKGHDR